MAFMFHKTNFGKKIRAISDDEEVARICGIDAEKIIGGAFFLSGALAGLAGILLGIDIGIQPTMGLLIVLEAATAAIIGGIGNVRGGILGAFILGFAENFGVLYVSGEWKGSIAFSLLALVLIFRPAGLFGRRAGF